MNGRQKVIIIYAGFICAAALLGLSNSPVDDGLRHVGMAFTDRDWSDVYPFSWFSKYPGYNPWFGYDALLSVLADGLSFFPGTSLQHKYILLKFVSTSMCILFVVLVVWRSRISELATNDLAAGFIFLVTWLALLAPALRSVEARPLTFGAMYVVFGATVRAGGRKGFCLGLLTSCGLAFLYTHMAWMFIFPVSFAQIVGGRRNFGVGTLLGGLAYLCVVPDSFFGFLVALVKAETLRDVLHFQVTEFKATWKVPIMYFYLLCVAQVLCVKRNSLCFTSPAFLCLMLFAYPALKHVRFFLDIAIPLLFVWLGKIFLSQLIVFIFYVQSKFHVNKHKLHKKHNYVFGKIFIVILSVVVIFSLYSNDHEKYVTLVNIHNVLNNVPLKSLVLTDFNLQYKVLFTRPDLSVVPSCELGFASPEIKESYIEFINYDNPCNLINEIKARFLIADGRFILNDKAKCVFPIDSIQGFNLFGVR